MTVTKLKQKKLSMLIISYFCYPDKSSAGLRPYGYLRYLQEEGVDVHFLTSLSKNQLLQIKDTIDVTSVSLVSKTRLRELGYKTKILVALEYLKLDKLFLFPDPYFMWIKRATKKGEQIIKQHTIDMILAVGMPFSDFVVGYNLSKKFNIPLFLDYQDPWSVSPLNPQSKFSERRARKLEKKILKRAKKVITVSERCKSFIPTNNINNIGVVYNGFFDMPNLKDDVDFDNKFTISFFGNFYGDLTKSLECLLGAMGKVIEDTNVDMVFQYAGSTSRRVLRRMLERTNMTDHFVDLGFIELNELHESINSSSVCFIPHPASSSHAVPNKVFDYLISDSHILFLFSDSSDLISSSVDICRYVDQSYTVSFSHNIDDILLNLYEKHREGNLSRGCKKSKLEIFSRKNQTKYLISCIKDEI